MFRSSSAAPAYALALAAALLVLAAPAASAEGVSLRTSADHTTLHDADIGDAVDLVTYAIGLAGDLLRWVPV